MKFIKIQYNNEIHKIMLPSNDFSYNDLCELILQSFYLKDGYLIKYKDLEKNEIIIGNNDDLIKAFDQFYMQKFVKFFVYNADLLESDKEEEEEKSEKINMEIKGFIKKLYRINKKKFI